MPVRCVPKWCVFWKSEPINPQMMYSNSTEQISDLEAAQSSGPFPMIEPVVAKDYESPTKFWNLLIPLYAMSRLLVRIRIIDNPYTHFCEQNPSGLIGNDATKDYVSDLYVKEKTSSLFRCFFENSTCIVRIERTFSIRYRTGICTLPYRPSLLILYF